MNTECTCPMDVWYSELCPACEETERTEEIEPEGIVSITHYPCPSCHAEPGEWCYERPHAKGTYHPSLAHTQRRHLTIEHNRAVRAAHNTQGETA